MIPLKDLIAINPGQVLATDETEEDKTEVYSAALHGESIQ